MKLRSLTTLSLCLGAGCALSLQAGVVLLPSGTVGTAADYYSGTNPGQAGWYYGDIRNNGTIGGTSTYDRTSTLATSTAPGTVGSLEINMTSGADKVGLNQYFGPGATIDAFALSDLLGASYDWYRSSSSTNPAQQAPALFFTVFDPTVGSFGLKYEPTYNGFGSTMATDAWQTSLIGDATNLWSWNAPSSAWNFSVTLGDWKTLFPNAQVVAMGVDAGSGWNGQFSGAVDFISVDRTGTTNDLFYDFQVVAVPEPATALMGLTGLFLIGLVSRRKRP